MLAGSHSLENIMQTSRFQLGLIAVLALGLGYTLSSSPAVGYPAGSATSLGSNPVIAVGGTVSSSTAELFTAPADQDVVVTDVWLTMANRSCSSVVDFVTSAGATVSTVKLFSYFYEGTYEATHSQPGSVQHSFGSGLPLPAGQSLEIIESGGCAVAYTVSAYYAQP
jgi:hypothetical protein